MRTATAVAGAPAVVLGHLSVANAIAAPPPHLNSPGATHVKLVR